MNRMEKNHVYMDPPFSDSNEKTRRFCICPPGFHLLKTSAGTTSTGKGRMLLNSFDF